ncbi:general substrate transporter [Mycena alexandri]|uniref:General substrate transporter n=1 Tax=Mycena alexandri TaxID=1745969 RepID=A0AAD6SLG8_9AGAR|nr:general substrate transporter [Mycena alexandri]
MPLSPKVYTWLCGLFASLGSIIFGYDLGVIAGWANANLQGLVVSILGALFFGMIPVAYAADLLGRRVTIQIGAGIYILGGALQTGAQNMSMMLAGRFFAGFGIGIMSDLAPLYQAEIAHPSIRGRLTTLQQFMLGIGAFVASWIVRDTFGCSAGLSGQAAEWRVPLGIQIIPALPLISFILLLPESPRWLAEKGRMDEGKFSPLLQAQATLARLHAHGDINDPFVVAQMKDIQADISKSKEIGEASWSELFTVPSNFRRLSLGYILQFSVQMTGVSAIQYYSTTMGFSSTRILLFQSINSIIALIGEAACVIWIDATGRRIPMIVGNFVSGMSFVVGAILMARWPGTVNNTWVFNFFFSACIGPLSWAYPAEIYSTRTRAKATAITSSGSFIAQVTSPAFLHIGWNLNANYSSDLVFAICGHTNALFIWAFYPETTGRRLEEMDALFENAPLFVPGTPYAKVGDHRAAERELRQGTIRPGDLTERTPHTHDEEDGKGSTEKIE